MFLPLFRACFSLMLIFDVLFFFLTALQAHEIVVLEIITLLLERATDDSVEVAVSSDLLLTWHCNGLHRF